VSLNSETSAKFFRPVSNMESTALHSVFH